MKHDPKTTWAIALTYPHGALSSELASWFYSARPASRIITIFGPDVIIQRNMTVVDHILKAPPEITTFLLFDWDNRPIMPSMQPFLDAEADIVGAKYPVGNPHTWDNELPHCGSMKVKRSVFEKITPPWFQFVYSPDGTKLEQCECNYFIEKAKAAGFSIMLAGECGHHK